MGNLLGNSSVPNYVKITATCILGSTYIAALGVAVDTYIMHGASAEIPSVVSFVLGTGLGLALQVLGLHQGASLAETPPTANIPPNTISTTTMSNTTRGGPTDASPSTP